MPDLAARVTFDEQTRNGQPPEMLTGCANLNLQLLGNLTDTKFRLRGEKLENFYAPVIGKSPDDPLEPLRPRSWAPYYAFRRLHKH